MRTIAGIGNAGVPCSRRDRSEELDELTAWRERVNAGESTRGREQVPAAGGSDSMLGRDFEPSACEFRDHPEGRTRAVDSGATTHLLRSR